MIGDRGVDRVTGQFRDAHARVQVTGLRVQDVHARTDPTEVDDREGASRVDAALHPCGGQQRVALGDESDSAGPVGALGVSPTAITGASGPTHRSAAISNAAAAAADRGWSDPVASERTSTTRPSGSITTPRTHPVLMETPNVSVSVRIMDHHHRLSEFQTDR